VIKQRPSLARLVAMVLFTASCAGILGYLWLTFGGAVPLRPEGYRVEIRFSEATRLAHEADVRISGVNVGKVKAKRRDVATGTTRATLELDERYAPIPHDTRAILRQKTLLGETYVELTPGGRQAPKLADGGTLASAQVAPTVELDEIFRTFDPKTRAALTTWLDQQGRAVGGEGQALNDALGRLTPFAQDSDAVLRLLDRQRAVTRGLVRDTGAVFEALSERQGQLRGLIDSSNRVFETTASRDRRLAEAIVALPTFLRETRSTTRRLTDFARRTDPLVTQLRPAARELSPTLIDLEAVAPDLRGVLRDLGPLIRVARPGLPALQRVLDDARPFLARLEPFLRSLQPTLDYVGLYRREIAAFLANDAAATQATDPSPVSETPLSYLRTTNPLNPEVLAAYAQRNPATRSNPYVAPGGYDRLGNGLRVFGEYLCTAPGPPPRLAANDPNLTPALRRIVQQFVFTPNGVRGPACREQRPLGELVGQTGRFPRLQQIPAP